MITKITPSYLHLSPRHSRKSAGWRYLILVLLFCSSAAPVLAQTGGTYSFEDGSAGNWVGEGASELAEVSNTTARTGNYSLKMSTTSTSSSAKHWRSYAPYADNVASSNSKIHFIYWVKTDDAGIQSDASMRYTTSVPDGTSSGSASNQTTATSLTPGTWTRVTYTTSNGSRRYYFPSPRRTNTGAATLYMDDAILYISANSVTDIYPPGDPSLLAGVAAGAHVSLTWTSNDDTTTSVEATLILRTSNMSAAAPSLNDQGVYSAAGGAAGPNTVGDWTIISSNTGATATDYADNGLANGSYKYAVVLRDQAYNYSNAAVSATVTVSGGVTPPAVTVNQTGFTGSFGNTAATTTSATQQYTVGGTNLTSAITITAPAGFEVSQSSSTGFSGSLSLTPVSGTVAGTTVYVRFAPAAATGATGNLAITHVATGVTTQSVTVSGNALAAEPTTSGTITFGAVTGSSIEVNLPTTGNGSKRIIVARATGAVSFVPADASSVTGADANFGNAADLGSGNRLVYNGNGSGSAVVTVTGLTQGTTYYFTVYEYNEGTGTSQNYRTTSPASGNTTTTVPAATITLIQGSFDGNYGNLAAGDVSAEREYSVSAADLTGDLTITAPAGFEVSVSSGSGYSGSLTLTPVNGDIAGTTIYVRFAPLAATGSTGMLMVTHTSTGAVTRELQVSGNALAAVPATSGSIGFGAVTSSSVSVHLPSVGDGDKRIIVVRAGSPVSYTPQNGIAPTVVQADYSSAADQGNGNRIVYNGNRSGNDVVLVTGLNSGETYYFSVFEYNEGTGTSQNYLTRAAATADTTTESSSGVAGISRTTGEIVVYPNPATDYVYIGAGVPVKVHIIDIHGRVAVSCPAGSGIVPVSNLAGGIYLLQVSDITGHIVHREKLQIAR